MAVPCWLKHKSSSIFEPAHPRPLFELGERNDRAQGAATSLSGRVAESPPHWGVEVRRRHHHEMLRHPTRTSHAEVRGVGELVGAYL